MEINNIRENLTLSLQTRGSLIGDFKKRNNMMPIGQ